MHEPDALVVSSPRSRRLGRLLTWGVPCLFLVLVLGILILGVVSEVRMRARARTMGYGLDIPDRVQVLYAVWRKKDLYEIKVRLSRSDGKPLFGHYGIRLTDVAPGGFGEISDYSARSFPPRSRLSTVDVIAYQLLPEVPRGPLTLRIDGYAQIPHLVEPSWVPYVLGPMPRRPAIQYTRYPLAGGEVTLPAPPRPAERKSARD